MSYSKNRRTEIREPVHKPWLWIAMGVVIVGGSPLFWTSGTIEPLVFGIPLWLLWAVAFTLAFAVLVSVACMRLWNVEEPGEERAFAEGRDPWARTEDEDTDGGGAWRT